MPQYDDVPPACGGIAVPGYPKLRCPREADAAYTVTLRHEDDHSECQEFTLCPGCAYAVLSSVTTAALAEGLRSGRNAMCNGEHRRPLCPDVLVDDL